MAAILSLIEINLIRPLCEHAPSPELSPWAWEIFPTKVNGELTYGLRSFCKECGAEDSISICKFVASFTVSGRQLQQRRPPTKMERDFTPFDDKYLKKFGILKS